MAQQQQPDQADPQALARANAGLLAAQQRQIGELRAIGTIGKRISASFDFQEMLDAVYHELSALTHAPVFFLAICNPEDYCVTNAIFIEQGERIPIDWEGQTPAAGSLTDWILRQRKPLLFRNLPAERQALETLAVTPQPLGPDNLVRSWIGVPLLAPDNAVVGILSLQDYDAHRYDELTLELLQQVASHVSLGVQKVRLFAERERQNAENTRLLTENARLYAESLTQVEQELAIARQIQSHLFPQSLPRLPGIAIAACCRPARETGGDFYDVVELQAGDEPLLGLMIGDASGKSIPGAMLMAIARSIIRSEARDHLTPALVLRETNELLAHDVPPRSFVALCYATITEQGRFSLANAAQMTPLRRRADGRIEEIEVPEPRLPLGIAAATTYQAVELRLDAGDTLVFITDGIVEARNAERELFGFERLETLVRMRGGQQPQALVDAIFDAVDTFVAPAAQHDDMTVVVLQVTPRR